MLTETEKVNIANNDHFVVFLIENRLMNQLCDASPL
jgi:hypothetical protein